MMNRNKWMIGGLLWGVLLFGSVLEHAGATTLVTATVGVFRNENTVSPGNFGQKPTVLIVVYGRRDGVEQAVRQAVDNIADFYAHSGMTWAQLGEHVWPEIPDYIVEYLLDKPRHGDPETLGAFLKDVCDAEFFPDFEHDIIWEEPFPSSNVVWTLELSIAEPMSPVALSAKSSDTSQSGVPEPSSWLLFAFGGVLSIVGIRFFIM